jgi:exonuclease III
VQVKWEGGGTELAWKYPTDDVKDSFCKELKRVLDKFTKYYTRILLGDFNTKVGREDILKPTTGNESLHEICNDKEVKVVNFATSKNLSQTHKVSTSQQPYNRTSPDGKHTHTHTHTIRSTIFW